MVIVLAVLVYGCIPVIPLGWQIYVKANADQNMDCIIDYCLHLGLCYTILRKLGQKYIVV